MSDSSTFRTAAPAEPERPRIGVLDRNRAVAQRAARVIRCAAGFQAVACEADPASMREALADDPILLACDGDDLDVALEWTQTLYPSLHVLVWSSGSMDNLLRAAAASPRVISLIGWPSYASMPRPWELSLATRRICDPTMPRPRFFSELVAWGGTVMKYLPATTDDIGAVTSDVLNLAERAGTPARTAQRAAEVAHEMLVDALYDAPVDAHGGAVRLRPQAVGQPGRALHPTFRFASDGEMMALQVTDPSAGCSGAMSSTASPEGARQRRPPRARSSTRPAGGPASASIASTRTVR